MRPEYRALVDGLPSLMGNFGCELSEVAFADSEILMAAVDCVDQTLDDIADAGARRAFSDALLAYLGRAEGSSALEGPPTLAERMSTLRALVELRDVKIPFIELVTELLDNSERIRTALEPHDYVECVEREGRLTVELALLFVTPPDNQAFLSFFRAIAEPANLFDKLVDVRADFARGELALRPTLGLHALLALRLFQRGRVAMTLHPRRVRFVAWSLGWLLRMSLARPTTRT
jgi:hypothetical protein